MAVRLGAYDSDLRPEAWFDSDLIPDGWWDRDLIDVGGQNYPRSVAGLLPGSVGVVIRKGILKRKQVGAL